MLFTMIFAVCALLMCYLCLDWLMMFGRCFCGMVHCLLVVWIYGLVLWLPFDFLCLLVEIWDVLIVCLGWCVCMSFGFGIILLRVGCV